ncbi:2,4-diaminopentanoate dehydrogenase [subsurface metagenome]
MGTGVNPGLACDAIPIFLSGALANLKKIRMRRVADISPYVDSQTIMTHFGIGLTPEEYQKKVEEGIVVGHWGSTESLAVIADTLGWPVKMEQTKEPLIAKTRLDISGKRIEPGQVYGSKQVDRGLMDGEEVIVIELVLALKPETGGAETGMWYRLEGEPNIEVKFVSGITGPEEVAKVTIARAINAIPYVVRAKPGLLSVNEVGVISYLS